MKPTWSSASFLLYAGGIAVLVAAWIGLGDVSSGNGNGTLAGWAALVFVVLAALAGMLRRAERPIAAGIFAFLAVLSFGVLVGALEAWWGWLPDAPTLDGFPSGLLLLEFALIAAAFFALKRFHFPLIVLVVAVTVWYLVTDVLSSGGSWTAVVTLLVGLVFLLVGRSLDHGPRRPYGFWMHVAAGLTVGGALLYWWHSSDADWALIAVAGLVYVAVAAGLGRSSWAVLGAFGLLLAAMYFASTWSHVSDIFFFEDDESAEPRIWVWAVVLAFLGFLYAVLGLLLERRRRAAQEV